MKNYKNGKDFYWSSRDFIEDENHVLVAIYVEDEIRQCSQEYKLHFNKKGGYFIFHGQRVYVTVPVE